MIQIRQLDPCCKSNANSQQWYAFNTFCRMSTDDDDLAPAVLRAAEVTNDSFIKMSLLHKPQ